MLIKLPDINTSKHNEHYVGNRKRLATASGCCFISDNLLVINHLVGQKLFFVSFDYNKFTYNIVNQVDTTFHDDKCITDLIDNVNKLIATSNFDTKSFSIYEICGEYIRKLKDYHFPELGYCHGIKFYDENIICFTTVTINYICFYDISENKELYKFDLEAGRPKDVCFISKNKMIVLYTINNPNKDNYNLTNSVVYLINFDLNKQEHVILSEFIVPNSQLDSCVCNNSLVFVTVVGESEDSVLILSSDNNTLSIQDKLTGFNFPHGVALRNNLLAVTNYGDNTVKIINLNLLNSTYNHT